MDDSSRHLTKTTTSRRSLIAALVSGGAVASVTVAGSPVLGGAAVLAADDTTTTTPPRRVDADAGVLNRLLGLERSAVDRYRSVAGSAALSEEERAVILAFHGHHQAYADAIKGYLGSAASTQASGALADATGTFDQLVGDLIDLEAELVDSHADAAAQVRGTEAAALIASIAIGESRHRAALAIVSGASVASVI